MLTQASLIRHNVMAPARKIQAKKVKKKYDVYDTCSGHGNLNKRFLFVYEFFTKRCRIPDSSFTLKEIYVRDFHASENFGGFQKKIKYFSNSEKFEKCPIFFRKPRKSLVPKNL